MGNKSESGDNYEIPKWMDSEREEAFEQITELLQKLPKEKMKEWFVQLTNALQGEAQTPMQISDITSLDWYGVESKSAGEVAGIPINRPVFIFSDIGEYQNFSRKINPSVGNASRGMVIHGNVFPENSPFHKTGLIVGTPFEEYISHEVFHTIDPNINNRKGYHECLTEISAYLNQNRGRETGEIPEIVWNRVVLHVASDDYYNDYSKRAENKLTPIEYKEVVSRSVAALRRVYATDGYIEMQRKLLKSKTVLEVVM